MYPDDLYPILDAGDRFNVYTYVLPDRYHNGIILIIESIKLAH